MSVGSCASTTTWKSALAGTSPSVCSRRRADQWRAIVAKQGKGTVEETGLARGAVAFFAPRAAGAFVFRLLDPEPPGQQQKPKSERPKASSNVYATSDKLDVVVRTHDDLLDSLKASLQQLEEPGRSRLGALQQLAVVAETLPASLAPENDSPMWAAEAAVVRRRNVGRNCERAWRDV